ncbi:hypothetical protein [Novosphingobium terrae]|uniref:hypothetical protein n=1 Tax=Novosphingobium terrae TaxID=2726189 RepID=UPI00197DC1AB|nr:hypothetical protein [Novosphingobium terrae]
MSKAHRFVWRGRIFPSALDILLSDAAQVTSPKTLLIGWELGGGNGHIERMIPVVSAYLELGWRVVIASRDVERCNHRFAHLRACYRVDRLAIIACPSFRKKPFPSAPLVSLAQIFSYMGYSDRNMVEPLVRQWEKILRQIRPDRVLSDYAPALNLAARGRLPLLVIGNGWTLPPSRDVVPAINPLHSIAEFRYHEEQIVDACVGAVGSGRAPRRFCDLLRGDINAICVIPELDPYRKDREEPYVWSPEMPTPAPRPITERDRGIVYLPPNHPHRDAVVRACSQSNLPFRGYFGGLGAGQHGNLKIESSMLNFVEEIPKCKVVIHHGGLSTAMWSMVNAINQWIIPADLEKKITKLLVDQDIKNSGAQVSGKSEKNECCENVV